MGLQAVQSVCMQSMAYLHKFGSKCVSTEARTATWINSRTMTFQYRLQHFYISIANCDTEMIYDIQSGPPDS